MYERGRGPSMGMSLDEGPRDAQNDSAAIRGACWMELAAITGPVGLWWVDLHSERSWISAGVTRILGRDASDPLDRADMLAAIHPEDRDRVITGRTESFRNSAPFVDEFRIVRPNGEDRLVRATVQFLHDYGLDEFIGVLVDITDQHQMGLDLDEQRAQLAHFNRLSVVGQLSGAVVHEISQPLTSILANARAAARAFESRQAPSEDYLREIVYDIAGAAMRTTTIVHRFRALLRSEPPRSERLDLTQIIAEVVAAVQSELLLREVRLKYARDAIGPIEVVGDAVQLQQVLINLIINACDALQSQPVDSRRITLRARAVASGNAHVTVSDSGTGIRMSPIDRIFDAFFTSKEGGVGLGLAICRKIATAHHGRIWAENRSAGGAAFHLVLPGISTASPASVAGNKDDVAQAISIKERARAACEAARERQSVARALIERLRQPRADASGVD